MFDLPSPSSRLASFIYPATNDKSPQKSNLRPRVLVCPSGFKESLGPEAVADCIESGILRAFPKSKVTKAPMVDGGEGFTKALVAATAGEVRMLCVIGPVREEIESHFGYLGGTPTRTAVVEMAAAAGLSLVPKTQRNPLYTTTFGVGQLIRAGLDEGAERILVGCGDSGTCDGGIGMAQALGARFYDLAGKEIPIGGGGASLTNLASVDLSELHPGLATCTIDVACNWHNVLCGPTGVAEVFGPQKGASKADVARLSISMSRVSSVVSSALGRDVSLLPGSGASGGMGAALMLIGATLYDRFSIITKYLNITDLVRSCDIVITAEGGIDEQTPRGKVPAEVARIAKLRNIPVIALAGTVGEGARSNYEAGIDAFASILQAPVTLQMAISDAERLLIDAAESTMRMVMIGCTLNTVVVSSIESESGPERVIVRRANTFQ